MDDISWEGLDVLPANIVNFMGALENWRSKLSQDLWKSFVETDQRLNDWRQFLLNDPYTRWGYDKPRGYPGDATLMDFAYKHESVKGLVQESSELGKLLYKHTSSAAQSFSAVSRTKFISELISNSTKSKISIASIASGHGREFEYISEDSLRNIKSVLAIDSDNRSLETLQTSSLENVNVISVNRNIFKTRLGDYGPKDMVYSLGLFDYLNDDSAVKVLDNMCGSAKPEGTVVVANLHHQAANLGYCEAIMDWWMITRNEEDLMMLSKRIQNIHQSWKAEIERIDCFCYLIMRTASASK